MVYLYLYLNFHAYMMEKRIFVPCSRLKIQDQQPSSLVLLTKVLPVEVEDVRGVEKISGAGIAPCSLLLRGDEPAVSLL